MRDPLATVGAVILAAVCCALPLLVLGGLGVFGGIAWGRVALIAVGVVALALAAGRTVAVRQRRLRRRSGLE